MEGRGLQPGEQELEEQSDATQPSAQSGATGENSSGGATSNIEPDSEAVAMLLSMGIDVTQAITALKVCNNNAQRAIEYIFDPDSFNPQPEAHNTSSSRLTIATRSDPLKMKLFTPDEKPKLYQLKAFISHMGQSTMCGHYVCHIKKDEKWYIFNDNKVAVSEKPPREFGYLYIYERVTA
jgi:ubiquitin carboxyl-terminal hydrolase 5/13